MSNKVNLIISVAAIVLSTILSNDDQVIIWSLVTLTISKDIPCPLAKIDWILGCVFSNVIDELDTVWLL